MVRQETSYRTADDVVRRHPEDPLGRAIVRQHPAVGAEGDDGIEAVVDQLAHHAVLRRQGADVAGQRVRLVLDAPERGDAERQHQADQAGAGVHGDGAEGLGADRHAADREQAAPEQEERASPGRRPNAGPSARISSAAPTALPASPGCDTGRALRDVSDANAWTRAPGSAR